MKKLLVFPTSRALRKVSESLRLQEGFLPTLMRMDEFESRAVILPDKILVDPLYRIMLLRRAADFSAFENLKVDRGVIRFFTKSDALFKFFEELAQEGVDFEKLAGADAYAEFVFHLEILEQLRENYRKLLESEGLTDKAFIPTSYSVNEGFLQDYEEIEIYLEGYLSHFEMELIVAVSKRVKVLFHMESSCFNRKMQERFALFGLKIPDNSSVLFDLSNREILEAYPNRKKINVRAFSVEERYEQIALAFEKVEEMVESGIAPESIALILPDEGIKEAFELYDTHHNLNFAMGFDYSRGEIYKKLEALYSYWQEFDRESRVLLERYGMEMEKITSLSSSGKCGVEAFFNSIASLSLLDIPLAAEGLPITEEMTPSGEKVYESYRHFLTIFKEHTLSLKEWLFIWLKRLSRITMDDVRGGKITAMGVLETRGVSFDGVVIVDFNEGIVPASSAKDQFLNSSVRLYAGLPTLGDREALQKQYYKRLLEQAKVASILYATAENRLPSKFLYELGIEEAERQKSDLTLLYEKRNRSSVLQDPVVELFDAESIIWSASRLKSWLECKRKYYYRYIEKLKAKEEEEINEGAFLHRLLDHLYRDNDHYLSVEMMKEKIERVMDELLPEDDAKIAYQKLLWREKLKGYIEREIRHFEEGWRVVAHEEIARNEIGGLHFEGRIDRIDRYDNGVLVIDYKSGSTQEANRSKNLEKLSDFQMSIYAHLLSDRYDTMDLAFMKILEGGKLEYITALKEKNSILSEHITELKETKAFIAAKCEDLSKCTYCEFALMCGRGVYL